MVIMQCLGVGPLFNVLLYYTARRENRIYGAICLLSKTYLLISLKIGTLTHDEGVLSVLVRPANLENINNLLCLQWVQMGLFRYFCSRLSGLFFPYPGSIKTEIWFERAT